LNLRVRERSAASNPDEKGTKRQGEEKKTAENEILILRVGPVRYARP